MAITVYDELNNIPDRSWMAGSDKVLTFSCYESDGVNKLSIETGQVEWRLCPYGEFSINVLTKSTETSPIPGITILAGSPPYQFEVAISGSETASLSGKYIQQVVITDFFGNTVVPGQGTVVILPLIASA